MRTNTPYSFREQSDMKLIFSSEFQYFPKDHLLSLLEKLEGLPCLSIMPEELFFYSYPELISCANPSCINSFNQYVNSTSNDYGKTLTSKNYTEAKTEYTATGSDSDKLVYNKSTIQGRGLSSSASKKSSKSNITQSS